MKPSKAEKSRILDMVHETGWDLHELGSIEKRAMCRYDTICLKTRRAGPVDSHFMGVFRSPGFRFYPPLSALIRVRKRSYPCNRSAELRSEGVRVFMPTEISRVIVCL